jgi:multiple sugar transport system permease protein
MNQKVTTLVMILPTLLIILTLSIYPTIIAFYTSFTNLILTSPTEQRIIGIENYINIFTKDTEFLNSLIRTFIFVTSSVLISGIFGVVLAVLVYNATIGKNLFKTLFIIPMVVPAIIVGVSFKFMLNYDIGVINYFLEILRIGRQPFLGNPSLAFLSIILTDIWQGSSFVFLITLAGLESLPISVIEAAMLDGASAWRLYKNIHFSLIRKYLIIAIIFRIIDTFKVYDTVFIMTAGGPGTATQLLNIYLTKQAFEYFRMGYASALAIFVLFFVILLTNILLKLFRLM